MLKLGKKITIFSKEYEINIVHKVVFDFGKYDNEFLIVSDEEKELFLDEIDISYQALDISNVDQNSPIFEYETGTVIVIEELKGNWDENKIKELKEDFVKFSPLEISDKKVSTNKDFEIRLYKNNIEDIYYEDTMNRLKDIIEQKSLYKIQGEYNEQAKTIIFSYSEANQKRINVSLPLINDYAKDNEFAQKMYGLTNYRKYLKSYYDNEKSTVCGNFNFEFYIFDFAANRDSDFGLYKDEKDIIRDHRVFLYRDDVRVQPYGAANDDWLQIDRNRATTRASEMFSNDQLIGQIKITKKNNGNLKDKTSREGIIEDGRAFEQLINIVRTFLSLIRTNLYQNYCFKNQRLIEIENETKQSISISKFAQLEKTLENDKSALENIAALKIAFETQKQVYEKRLNIAESLAGIGLSVEVASHDIMLTMDRLKDRLIEIKEDFNSPLTFQSRLDIVKENVISAEEMFALIYMKMKDLQQVFVSSKQRQKLIRVEDIAKKIQSIYAKQYKKHEIEIEYIHLSKSPVVAKVIDAVLFQVFINLFDNALYWLQQTDIKRKVILTFDGNEQTVLFSDNGIGVPIKDAPYIFDAFFSGKGEDGRGLGLYIAKRLLNKNKYNIELVDENYQNAINGANFLLTFVSDSEVI